MKNLKFNIFILLILIFVLTSCAKQLDRYIPETYKSLTYDLDTLDLSNVSQVHDYEHQIQVLYDNLDIWAIKTTELEDKNGYCITDLDNNGLIEVIVSKVNNTTNFTTNNIYEVNNNLNGISLIEWTMPNGAPGPTFIKDKINVYIDNHHNNNIYVLKTLLNVNQYEYSENITTLVLENGKISQNFIGFNNVTAINDKKNVDKIPEVVSTYADSVGNPITAEKYDIMEADLFGGKNYTSAVATLEWITFDKKNKATISNITSFNKNDLMSKLSHSFNEFHIILN